MNAPSRRGPRRPGNADLSFLLRLLAAVAAGVLMMLAAAPSGPHRAPAQAGVVR